MDKEELLYEIKLLVGNVDLAGPLTKSVPAATTLESLSVEWLEIFYREILLEQQKAEALKDLQKRYSELVKLLEQLQSKVDFRKLEFPKTVEEAESRIKEMMAYIKTTFGTTFQELSNAYNSGGYVNILDVFKQYMQR